MNYVILIHLLLLFTSTISTIERYCPTRCNCRRNTVYCQDGALSGSEFKRMGNETESENVKEMVFIGQNITSLDMCLFKRFTKLKEFIFSFSSLKKVPTNPGCIPGHDIRRFQVNNNEIEELSQEDFEGYERINQIWLSNNKIRRLKEDTFTKLESIVDLRLDANQMEQIDSGAFNGLKDIRALHLQNNRLTRIENDVFQSIKRIGVLLLNDNQLTSLAPLAFNHLQIVQLNLRSNKLKEIPPQVFQNTSIVSLALSSNPLHCSCQALVTLTSIQDANIKATCDTPETFKSKKTFEVIDLVTDPCSKTRYCVDEYPQLIEHLNRKQKKTIVCPTPAPPIKDKWFVIQIVLISIGVLFVISILSFVIGYNYKKRKSGMANLTQMDVKMNGFTSEDGSYIRDHTHYVETLEGEENKAVSIKSVRRKISTAFFGSPRKQSLANTATVNGVTPTNNNQPAPGVVEETPKRKKTVFQMPPIIKEEDSNGVNKAFEMEEERKYEI